MDSGQGLGQLRLRRIVAISNYGKPVLDGTNARVLAAGLAKGSDIGRMAACQDLVDADEDICVVPGLLIEDQTDPTAPLRIEHGAASLTLHPDGRIRITGADIAMDAEQEFSVLTGRIDLN